VVQQRHHPTSHKKISRQATQSRGQRLSPTQASKLRPPRRIARPGPANSDGSGEAPKPMTHNVRVNILPLRAIQTSGTARRV
jgi:hypothetical protein